MQHMLILFFLISSLNTTNAIYNNPEEELSSEICCIDEFDFGEDNLAECLLCDNTAIFITIFDDSIIGLCANCFVHEGAARGYFLNDI